MTGTKFTDSIDKTTGVTDAGMGGFLPFGGDSSATGLYRFLGPNSLYKANQVKEK
jgi:hypothetical protein